MLKAAFLFPQPQRMTIVSPFPELSWTKVTLKTEIRHHQQIAPVAPHCTLFQKWTNHLFRSSEVRTVLSSISVKTWIIFCLLWIMQLKYPHVSRVFSLARFSKQTYRVASYISVLGKQQTVYSSQCKDVLTINTFSVYLITRFHWKYCYLLWQVYCT